MSLNRQSKKISLRRMTHNGKDYAMDINSKLENGFKKHDIYDKYLTIHGDLYKVGHLFISPNGRRKHFIKMAHEPSIYSSSRAKIKSKLNSINKKKYLEWADEEYRPGGPGFLRLVKKYNDSKKRPKSLSLKRKSNSRKLTRKLKTL